MVSINVMAKQRTFYSPLRYPGGKAQLANFMKLLILRNGLSDGEYAEVYAGGAGIAMSLLLEEYVSKVHINDLDKSVFSFWHSVLNETELLCQLINDVSVTMDEWYKQKAIQGRVAEHSSLEVGFSTFFLNRTNRSGILKGGVIGGKGQAGKWKLDVRFNKSALIQRIQHIAKYASRVQIYNLDAEIFITTALPRIDGKAVVYLDPPYFEKGQGLYSNYYLHDDHAIIAKRVAEIQMPWIVSYDSTPEIDKLYEGHRRIQYDIGYTAQTKYAGSELMFCSKALEVPSGCNPVLVTRKDIRFQMTEQLKMSI